MLPTFNLYGDFLLCDALSPKLGLLKKGDVVVCVNPRDSEGLVIKRVVAMVQPTLGRCSILTRTWTYIEYGTDLIFARSE